MILLVCLSLIAIFLCIGLILAIMFVSDQYEMPEMFLFLLLVAFLASMLAFLGYVMLMRGFC